MIAKFDELWSYDNEQNLYANDLNINICSTCVWVCVNVCLWVTLSAHKHERNNGNNVGICIDNLENHFCLFPTQFISHKTDDQANKVCSTLISVNNPHFQLHVCRVNFHVFPQLRTRYKHTIATSLLNRKISHWNEFQFQIVQNINTLK